MFRFTMSGSSGVSFQISRDLDVMPIRSVPEQQSSFENLKTAFANSTLLLHPDDSRPFILETDASDYAISGILSQYDENEVLRPHCVLCPPMFERFDNGKEFFVIDLVVSFSRVHLAGIERNGSQYFVFIVLAKHDIQISGNLKRKPEEPDMMSTMQPPKNRRIQEILGRVRTPRKKSGRVTDKKLRDIGKEIRVGKSCSARATASSSRNGPVGRLISFREIAVGAMEASPPLEIHGGTPKWTAPTLDQERNKPCSRMDMPLPQRETVPAQSKTVSDMVSLWNARSNVRSNDMDVDVNVNVTAPPPPAPVKYETQSVSAMEWAHSNTREDTTVKKVSPRTTEHVDPVSIAPVPLPRRSVSAEEMDRLWAESVERRNKMNIRSSFEIFQEAFSQRPWQFRGRCIVNVIYSASAILVAPSTSRTRPPLLPSNGRAARVLRVADPTRKKRMERL
ncbi:hypothetical protein BASA61_002744 [Batrachochytrium salamandrivorans]|nr:hypothetical protein BASA61_002744 [Batrachochytrium salamandrivorans]